MTDTELIQALSSMSVETGSLVCLGCGYEHDCGIHGCAIIRAAADRLAAYEDTGLEPEEIDAIAGLASENCSKVSDVVDKLLSDDAELDAYRALGTVKELTRGAALVKAQGEGRAFTSPVAIEQKIYKFSPLKSGVLEWMVIRVMKSKRGFDFEVISYSGITHRFSDEAIGKTVFLTRAEAENALEVKREC